MGVLVLPQHLHVRAEVEVAREQPAGAVLEEADVVRAVAGCVQDAEVEVTSRHVFADRLAIGVGGGGMIFL